MVCIEALAAGGADRLLGRPLWLICELDARVMLDPFGARLIHELFESCHAAIRLLRVLGEQFRSCMHIRLRVHKGILTVAQLIAKSGVLEAESQADAL